MKNFQTALLKIQEPQFLADLTTIKRAKTDDTANILINHGFKPATLTYKNEDWQIFSFLVEGLNKISTSIGLYRQWEDETFIPYIQLPLDIRREVYAAKLLLSTVQTPEVLTLTTSLKNNDDKLELPNLL